LKYPESHWDMVRPGLAAYGLYPGFLPSLTLKSKIVFLKQVPAGTSVSYGGSYKTRRTSWIATLPVGYADGYSRLLSNKGQVLVRGRRCAVVGMVTMDMLMMDVTEVPQLQVGEEVVLIGSQGKESIGVEEVCDWLETIPYELVCSLSARVPRIYL
ncbi:MAG: alanine racemase, partial [Elusimicrobia bacterium]|nr:alanine racemase [Elusimicrobiota bacterium]